MTEIGEYGINTAPPPNPRFCRNCGTKLHNYRQKSAYYNEYTGECLWLDWRGCPKCITRDSAAQDHGEVE